MNSENSITRRELSLQRPSRRNEGSQWSEQDTAERAKDKRLMRLYADNEKYDGYTRDGCVWKENIDIFDKMAVQIRYANKVQVSYSLTTYSPYEGYRIAFNGTRGRMDFWMHEKQPWPMENKDKIFRNPAAPDTFHQAANVRDGAMSVLIGVAQPAKSIDSGKSIRIADLTDIVPQAKKPG